MHLSGGGAFQWSYVFVLLSYTEILSGGDIREPSYDAFLLADGIREPCYDAGVSALDTALSYSDARLPADDIRKPSYDIVLSAGIEFLRSAFEFLRSGAAKLSGEDSCKEYYSATPLLC